MAVALENPRSPSTRLPSRPFLYSHIGKHRESYLVQVYYSTPETSPTELDCAMSFPLFRPAAAPLDNARHDSSSNVPTSKPCTSVSLTYEYAAPIENTQSCSFTSSIPPLNLQPPWTVLLAAPLTHPTPSSCP
ncbi:hypothetical protein BDP55DRAFT_128 [Colletotrichum godetiae]|uniref:Uncharacterized protein n=1 Tax=Colletotrichum godetiae TaxID=1209918 RepID=A0AAJ0B0E2_9PEZI|nr:uncharacterized protein BDP55DRAFT_128 [Colletotrichum godetiae]KAK1700807.1 hypothetical protein BDP55DRAFT_128 [Colletotrichum godetiae]